MEGERRGVSPPCSTTTAGLRRAARLLDCFSTPDVTFLSSAGFLGNRRAAVLFVIGSEAETYRPASSTETEVPAVPGTVGPLFFFPSFISLLKKSAKRMVDREASERIDYLLPAIPAPQESKCHASDQPS